MDFVVRLPKVEDGYDSIWVIIDRLTKYAHFLTVKLMFSAVKYIQLFINEIIRLYGVPISIISDRGSPFTSHFWKSFHEDLGTGIPLSRFFHPQTDGLSERTIQSLEDMLRVYALDFMESWDKHLTLIEFAYNNSFYSSIDMAPYEALYGRKHRLPLSWSETDAILVVGPELVLKTMEKIKII